MYVWYWFIELPVQDLSIKFNTFGSSEVRLHRPSRLSERDFCAEGESGPADSADIAGSS